MQSWIFSDANNRLSCDGEAVQLTPKAAAVLACLLRHKGVAVKREALIAEVWPGLHVTKDLVREYVFDLRSALHDDAKKPSYIETVRGVGFRLIGDIVLVSEEDGGAPGAIGEIRPTVAVLKPDTFETERAWVHFAHDLADDIITWLARFHDIAVVARETSFADEAITDVRAFASVVGANYLLSSSLTVQDQIVRVRFQLVDGISGRHLWAERYEDPVDTRLTLGAKLATAVVNALTGWHGELHRAEFKNLSRKGSDELNAFEHFIRACDLELTFDETSLRRSLHHLDRSLALDPTFARCWVVKAAMLQYAFDVFAERDFQLLQASGEALEKAYVLDPGDPVTLALTALKRWREGDQNSAIVALDRAEAACETDADACVCLATSRAVLSGDHAKARRLFDRALHLNPTPPSWYNFVEARLAFFAGDYRRSITAARSAPRQVSAFLFRCLSHAMLDEWEAARQAYQSLRQSYPQFDFEQFAAYFPIAHPETLQGYRQAVRHLVTIIEAQ